MLDQGHFGIEDAEKLQLCYSDVITDMEALVEEGWIRVVELTETSRDKEKKIRVFFLIFFNREVFYIFFVFFPRNQNEKDVEFSKEELPENCQETLAGLWKQIGDIKSIKWEEVLVKADLLEGQEREILASRQVKIQARDKAQLDEKGRLKIPD